MSATMNMNERAAEDCHACGLYVQACPEDAMRLVAVPA